MRVSQMALLALVATLALASTESASIGLADDGEYNEVSQGGPAGAPPRYAFDYSVQDARSGDVKSAWETRDGDVVRGAYSVLDPDGGVRTVRYASVGRSGFHAVVHKTYPAAVYEPPDTHNHV